MIALISGKVTSSSGLEVVVKTAGGVGYRITVSPNAAGICRVGAEVNLDTYLVAREDALELFGFANLAEKRLFKNFITVSGVGPKTALHLLSLGSVEEITLAVGRGDIDFLTKVSGIGKKTAERLVVELREKMIKEQGANSKEQAGNNDSAMLRDVIDGLITLGYAATQAREVARQLDAKGKTSEQLLREALRIIK